MKILIVEDNVEDRKVLQHYIEHFGHEVIEAENGKAGFAKALDHQPDLIISDALMPVMDGFQFLRQVKQHGRLRLTPFVFYSSVYQGDKDMELAMSIGADAFIIKPKEPDEFWKELSPVLQKGRTIRIPDASLVEEEYLKNYSNVVVNKLEEKVAELEAVIKQRTQMAKDLRVEKDKAQKYFDIAGVMLLVLDLNQTVVQINVKGCNLLGLEKEAVVGRKWCDFLPQKYRGRFEKQFLSLIQGDRPRIENDRMPVCTSNSSEKLISWHHCVLRDENGIPMATVSSGEDITERTMIKKDKKRIEKQLQRAQKMEALGTLAGGIAHDFNNILSAIIGYVELTKMKLPEAAAVQADLEQVLKAGERAKDLVGQILSFSRQGDMEIKPILVGVIVKEVLKLIRASFPATIEVRADISSTALIMGDPTSVHQIMMNLCTNAGHAMQRDGGILTLCLRDLVIDAAFVQHHPEVREGLYVCLTVSDTGYGMKPRVMQRIFDPFFTTKKKDDGTGMGLSVVHGIVKEYGGTIDVFSEPGKGSVFNVYLPAIEHHYESGVKAPKHIIGGNERILYVEDEAALAKMGQQLLESLGYRVVSYTSSIEALEYFNDHFHDIDLVITDMTMPHVTGEKIIQKCIAIQPDIPIILTTGFSAEISEEKAKALGAKAFVMKPILKYELARTIRDVLSTISHDSGR